MGGCHSDADVPINEKEVDLSHFEIGMEIGRGAFGKVHAVRHLQTDIWFAMKRQSKAMIAESKTAVRLLWNERNALVKVDSFFICNLTWAFQDKSEIYLVMPYMQGGDLRYHMEKRTYKSHGKHYRRFTPNEAQFYAAEVLLGLEALHDADIIYRDLKPENILMDMDGHVRLSDFGLCCELKEKLNYETRGRCGTLGYVSPEMIMDKWYDYSTDYWSYGVVVFELLHGQMPWETIGGVSSYSSAADIVTSESTTSHASASMSISTSEVCQVCENFSISNRFGPETQSLLRGLLTLSPAYRLGYSSYGWEDVKDHPFFDGIDWDKLANRQIQPPYKPSQEHNFDRMRAVSNSLADEFDHEQERQLTTKEQTLFEGFEFNTDLSLYDHLDATEMETETHGTTEYTTDSTEQVTMDDVQDINNTPTHKSRQGAMLNERQPIDGFHDTAQPLHNQPLVEVDEEEIELQLEDQDPIHRQSSATSPSSSSSAASSSPSSITASASSPSHEQKQKEAKDEEEEEEESGDDQFEVDNSVVMRTSTYTLGIGGSRSMRTSMNHDDDTQRREQRRRSSEIQACRTPRERFRQRRPAYLRQMRSNNTGVLRLRPSPSSSSSSSSSNRTLKKQKNSSTASSTKSKKERQRRLSLLSLRTSLSQHDSMMLDDDLGPARSSSSKKFLEYKRAMDQKVAERRKKQGKQRQRMKVKARQTKTLPTPQSVR